MQLIRRDLVDARPLKYFRAKTPCYKSPAGACHLTGKDRWFAFMQCLVIVRRQ